MRVSAESGVVESLFAVPDAASARCQNTLTGIQCGQEGDIPALDVVVELEGVAVPGGH